MELLKSIKMFLRLTECNAQINRAIAGMERYFAYYELGELENKKDGVDVELEGKIIVKDLNFKYDEELIFPPAWDVKN